MQHTEKLRGKIWRETFCTHTKILNRVKGSSELNSNKMILSTLNFSQFILTLSNYFLLVWLYTVLFIESQFTALTSFNLYKGQKTVNYFRCKLHLRCLTSFWKRPDKIPKQFNVAHLHFSAQSQKNCKIIVLKLSNWVPNG